MRKENLWAAFKYFDIENLGYITPNHLKKALIKAGMEITDEEAQNLIDNADLKHQNRIEFEEFTKFMMRNS